MVTTEVPVGFNVAGERLQGIVHLPENPVSYGIVVVVGGPQYRVGSHRQFVLLARFLAEHGVPVFRYDYRGMGDSGGDARNFEDIQLDIRAAIDEFFSICPEIREVIIWGLCDAASAASFYAGHDQRVSGLVLLNPWIRTEAGAAKAYLKHYYLSRLLNQDFWRKVLRGDFRLMASLKSLLKMFFSAVFPGKVGATSNGQPSVESRSELADMPLPDRMYEGLDAFGGQVLFILSGDDLVAGEFRDHVAQSRAWKKLLAQSRVVVKELEEANHTFSRREWRETVAQWTLNWLRAW